MKDGLSKIIKSIFGSRGVGSNQSSNIYGNNNTVHQTIILSPTETANKSELLAGQQPSIPVRNSIFYDNDKNKSDDLPEVKKILEYRKIADAGNSDTALDLLEGLKNEMEYSSGYLAFRLNFNIGIILQNIGRLKAASEALKSAYAFYPKNNKAKTAKAFADLLEQNYKRAFEEASRLIDIVGDHRSLAACILLHAAKNLEDSEKITFSDEDLNANPSVVVARLDYLRVKSPDEYQDALIKANQDFPDEDAISIMWALGELDDMKRNLAFLLGAKMPDAFEEQVSKCAEIFYKDIIEALNQNPPNLLSLPSQANNAAVALRLSGDVVKAISLIERVLGQFPELSDSLLQIRASLLLQQDRDDEALALIEHSNGFPELQVMASELEAMRGEHESAVKRINNVLNSDIESGLRCKALVTKAQIGINLADQNVADEAFEELIALPDAPPELVHLRSAYDRVFAIVENEDVESKIPVEKDSNSETEKKLLDSVKSQNDWDFITLLHVAGELFARKLYRQCADLLKDKVSFSKESPALSRLCDACVESALGTLADEIWQQMTPKVRESVFGIKFGVNVSYLNGEVTKAIPLTRKLFEQNPHSIRSLELYIQSLLRNNERNRIQRVIKGLSDFDMVGSVEDKRLYVNLLVYCGKIERARKYAYHLYCMNQNDHRSWLALSSSVLAFGHEEEAEDRLSLVTSVQLDCTVEIKKPDGAIQTYTIEADAALIPLLSTNIPPDHPIALAAFGKAEKDTFEWPIAKLNGQATMLSVKHKTVAAFHLCLSRFEEQFPNISGFKSVSVSPEPENGLDEMKALIRQQAEYAQQKAKQYNDGNFPLYILAYNLGIDPIDAFLGLKSDCGYSLKVTACTTEDQENANLALQEAKLKGVICDATVCYLIRRLEIEEIVKEEFGGIGITQETINIFSNRVNRHESSFFHDSETGEKKAARLAMHDDGLVMSEQSQEQIENRSALLQADLQWLKNECELIPSIAKRDPADQIIKFRKNEGGRFFDDIFASDGTDRVLISEDFHVRQWGKEFFAIKASWLQALIHYLEEKRKISLEKSVTSTLELIRIGEHALTTNSARLLQAAKMWAAGEWTEDQFVDFCSIIGQDGAGFISHWDVGYKTIRGLWGINGLDSVRAKSTSILLRNLIRIQPEITKQILDAAEANIQERELSDYIRSWRIGHFV